MSVEVVCSMSIAFSLISIAQGIKRFNVFLVDPGRAVELLLLPVLLEFHHQPLLLCSVQRSFQKNLHPNTYFQVEGIAKTASEYLLLWLR